MATAFEVPVTPIRTGRIHDPTLSSSGPSISARRQVPGGSAPRPKAIACSDRDSAMRNSGLAIRRRRGGLLRSSGIRRGAAGVGVVATLLGGCGSEGTSEASAVRIGWISKGQCNTFFDISRFGVRLAEVELAEEPGKQVQVEMFEPDDCSAEIDPAVAAGVSEACVSAAPQMAAVQAAREAGVDAIAISVGNPACLKPLLDAAVEDGVQVITFDSDAPESLRHTYYGMDNEAGARLAVRTLAQLIGEKGQVAIQTSMTEDADGTLSLSKSVSYVDRMSGISAEFERFPEIEVVATVPCIGGEVTDAACATELEKVLVDYPDLKGFLLARGKMLRELDLADKAPLLTARVQQGTLHSVAFDAPDDALENIGAGYADLAIAQKQFGWGYDVVRLAYQMVAEGLEPPSFYDSGWYMVCRDNVEAYARMWAAHDFRETLDGCAMLEN